MRGVIKQFRSRALSVYAGGVLLSLWAPVACGDGDTLPASSAGSGGAGAVQAGQAGQGTSGNAGHAGTGGNGNPCPMVAFISPEDGAKLTETDDVGAGT